MLLMLSANSGSDRDCLRAQPMLPAQLRRRTTRVLLFEQTDDLRVGETAFPCLVCAFRWAGSISD